MKLSNINQQNMQVLRDGEFEELGLTAEVYANKRLTYINDKKYIPELLKNDSISCVVTNSNVGEVLMEYPRFGLVVVDNPKVFFFNLHNKLRIKEDEQNFIDKNVKIEKGAIIADKNVKIEKGVIIESGVRINQNVHIKENSIIQSGSVIGANGFQYFTEGDQVIRVESAGKVIIGKNVEIRNNTSVDRGIFGDTIIGDNVKIDNLCHIAHDVNIGNNSLIVAGTIIGGRVSCGENTYTGPNSAIRNGLTIGDNGRVTMGSVVVKDVKENETVTGNFAIEHSKFLKLTIKLLKLLK